LHAARDGMNEKKITITSQLFTNMVRLARINVTVLSPILMLTVPSTYSTVSGTCWQTEPMQHCNARFKKSVRLFFYKFRAHLHIINQCSDSLSLPVTIIERERAKKKQYVCVRVFRERKKIEINLNASRDFNKW
jgi:hypothetical protein